MLQLNEVIGKNDNNGVLVTLLDGRCAIVGLDSRIVNITVLLDTFTRWTTFDYKVSKKEIDEVQEILKNPKSVFEDTDAKLYLTDEKIKREDDELKKGFGYTY